MIETRTCHICKRKRPDDKILVLTKPLVVNGISMGSQNVCYCNDTADCYALAKEFSFIKDYPQNKRVRGREEWNQCYQQEK